MNKRKQSKQSPKRSNKQKPKSSNKAGPLPAEGGERLQKVLARGGLGSRREIERWIEEGRFRINGEAVKLGARLKAGDNLQLNGRVVHWGKFTEQSTRVLIYHKPTGEIVSRRDPDGRPVVFTRLPKPDKGRWIAVGRLDINTQGLLLLTNNGELAHRLMHPSSEIDREYAVRIFGNVDDAMIERLKQGVVLEDGEAHFDDIRFQGGEGINKWYHVTVKEGRHRLVRRLWESLGVTVSRLMRVRYGPVMLPAHLKAQHYYEMTDKELDFLLDFVGLAAEQRGVQSKSKRTKS